MRGTLGRSWLCDQFTHAQAIDLKLVDCEPIDSTGYYRQTFDREATDSKRPNRLTPSERTGGIFRRGTQPRFYIRYHTPGTSRYRTLF